MKIAIVHDDLVQWGGAERVLEGICAAYPDAPIFTSVYDHKNTELTKRFSHKKIVTSFLQKIPGWRFLYKALLPLYPIAFEQFDFSDYDVVISHTTRFAKSIITKPGTIHICYCHTPPRFLWHLSGGKNSGIVDFLFSYLRLYDWFSAKRVDYFISGSDNAKKRIKKIYQQSSVILHPFVDMTRFDKIEIFDGGYFLTIARLKKYKKIDLVVNTCAQLKMPLKIIGNGSELSNIQKTIANKYPKSHIEILTKLSDDKLLMVLAGCKALIIPGEEDFGLTSLEAQAIGKPVIAYASGGTLETVIQNKTGIFFDQQTVNSLKQAILNFGKIAFRPELCRQNALDYDKKRFISKLKQIITNKLPILIKSV